MYCMENRSCSGISLFAGTRWAPSLLRGSRPIHNCTIENNKLNCSLITNGSCDHSMDLGVVCRTEQECLEQVRSEDHYLAYETYTICFSPVWYTYHYNPVINSSS